VVSYDLDVTLPPAWIDLAGATLGSLAPEGTDTLRVNIHGTMADTTTAAVIRIASNDPAQPLVEVPVTTTMLRPVLAGTPSDGAAPAAVVLEAAAPNPFNPRTTIRFALPTDRRVDLSVHDVAGRLVRRLVAGETLPAGRHAVTWNGRDRAGRGVAAGVYLYRLEAGETVETRRMTLIK
jgi:hypothetical protein